MQCRIDFTLKEFDIHVDNVNKTITATADSGTKVPRPDYRETILSMLANWISGFSVTDSASGGSSVGRSLQINVNQLMKSTSNSDQETLFRGSEEFIQSLVDDSMVALASRRTVLEKETNLSHVVVGVVAVKFGKSKFIIGMYAFNLLVCSIYVGEALRTRFWRKMSSLDVMDMGSIVIGSLKGGVELAGVLTGLLHHHLQEGDSSVPFDEKIIKGNIRLNIREKDNEYRLLW